MRRNGRTDKSSGTTANSSVRLRTSLSGVTDFFKQIARGDDTEEAFKELGTRLADSFLEEFTTEVSKNLAAQLAGATSGVDISGLASAGTGASARTAGTSGGLLSAGTGGITGILSLITSPVALAAIIPAAVGAATYYIGRQVAGGTSGQTDRLGRDLDTLDDDRASRRRRGESQAAYEKTDCNPAPMLRLLKPNVKHSSEITTHAPPLDVPFKRPVSSLAILDTLPNLRYV